MKYYKEEVREKHKDLFDYSLDLVFIHDLKGNFLDANDIALETFGYERKEIQNLSFIDLIGKDQLGKSFEVIKEIKETGKQSKRHEYSVKTKEGKIIYIEAYGFPLKKKGKIYAILGIGHDITKRKLAEQKFKESEEKYRLITENANDIIGVLNEKFEIEYVNEQTIMNLLGYSANDVVGKTGLSFVHPDDLKRTVKGLYKGLEEGQHMEEIRFRHKNGHYIWFEAKGKTIIDKERATKGIVSLRDITERKKAEQKLKESEKKYRYLFENLPFSIFLFDSNGVIVDTNPATEKMIGYKQLELIGRHFKNASVIHPKYLPKLLTLFEEFLKGKKLKPINIEFYKKDGSLIWANIQSSLVKMDGKTFVQSIFRDITERKTAEFLVNEEIKKLKELDKIRKDLIIRISHELKTPLVPVCGGSELLLDRYEHQLGKDIKEIITLIKKGGERLNKLIDKLIDISRLEYGMLILEKQTNNLSEIIKECSNDMKYQIKEREITLNLDLPNNLHLNLDGIKIAEVIANLLSNAIKNTPPKGKIDISLKKKENWAIITVSDTGVGLSKEELNILFTMFGKIERYEKGLEYIDIAGSGLGLFISKEIVELHGGKTWAESKGRNKGSKFTVKLPIQ